MEEFYSIHKEGGFQDMIEAVNTLVEAHGLGDGVGEEFGKWVNEFVGDGYDIPVTLGLLIGLMAADHEQW